MDEEEKRQRPSGILRLDISKPRRSSGGSVEFRSQPELLGEHPGGSASPSSQQLSVTWAFQEADEDGQEMLKARQETPKQKEEQKDRGKESPIYMEPSSPLDLPAARDSEDEDLEEYSVSVSAIMQRRASTRGARKRGYRSPRRASSPMGNAMSFPGGPDRRRSSVYTTSSGDFEDGNQESTQEQIIENIRLHKEVIQSVKLQAWSIRRKLKLMHQAKSYVAQHEGALQERFAMSRSTRDLLARFKLFLAAKWQHGRRELANISTILIPWERRIKEIESHFGSVVASYFTFLRWLFWVNIVIAVVLTIFVVVPEIVATKSVGKNDDRKQMLPEEKATATNFLTIWDFEGFLKYSPLFYGYYSDVSGTLWGYKLPLAYFLTGLVVYIYSFVATLRKMAENSRMSKLSSKDDECVFSWKLFTGWDFMIGHAETAHNRVASVVLSFKEALLEEAEKKKDKRNWKVIGLRIVVNLIVAGLLVVSAYAVVMVVNRSTEPEANDTWWRRNEITIVMSLISFFFPMFFEGLGFMESYHPRQQLRLQLARIMLLNLLNLYSLIFALFDKITDMNTELLEIKANISMDHSLSLPRTTPLTTEAFSVDFLPTEAVSMADYIMTSVAEVEEIATTFLSDITSTVHTTISSWTEGYQEVSTTPNCRQVEVNCTVNATTFLTTLILSGKFNTTNNDTVFNETANETFYQQFNETFDYDSDYEVENYTTIYPSTSTIPIEITTKTTTTEEYYDYYDYPADQPSPDHFNFFNFIGNIFASKNLTENGTDWQNMTDFELFLRNFSSPDANGTMMDNVTDLIMRLEDFMPEEKCFEIVCDEEPEDGWSTLTAVTEKPSTSSDIFTQTTTEEAYLAETSTLGDTTTEVIRVTTGIEEKLSSTTFETPTMVTEVSTEPPSTDINVLRRRANFINNETKKKLRKLCWETMFGQELVKLTVMDLLITVMSTMLLDFFRALFVRFMNKCWCWDLEKRFPKYGDFKIAENILHLVNNQGMVWMGMFFSPGLAILNLIKLVIIMYLRSWAVLTCNVPHEVVFRASRSNNFYLALLLTMLFLCVLPVAFAIVWLEPSWHCGPFSNRYRIYYIFTETLRETLPKTLHKPLDYIASPSTVIPLLLLLVLIIYYLISLTNALREANQDLRNQLRRERVEERRKMLKLAENKPSTEGNAPPGISERWRKVLENATSPLTPTGAAPVDAEENKMQAKKELLQRIMKKALRKSSATSDEDSTPAAPAAPADDETDTEQHESLPHDQEEHDNRVNKQKHEGRPRESLPEILKKLREAAKRQKQEEGKESPEKKAGNDHPLKKFKVDRDPLTHRKSDFSGIPEKEKVPVFNFDLPNLEEDLKISTSEEEKDDSFSKTVHKGAVVCKEFTAPKSEKPKFGMIRPKKNPQPESPSPKSETSVKVDPEPVVKEPKVKTKFNSFFNLVKEAIQAKKDQEEIAVVEEVKGESSGTHPKKVTKRQDSMASIWSDNIPTITISKTESDECILEGKEQPEDSKDKDSADSS
ncbi:transmembrane channel-like protein [Phlebotomus argentipes]|uniref:transmembrane channel-like protein n=1 Tax=Phlebotomus argentipes TaxID=94469 RepID=UPI0028936A49|nr:transmembrane channel-like protein [Phlebotomus argentipes]